RSDKNYWDRMKEIGCEALENERKGRAKKVGTPDDLWNYACEYFKEVDETPYKHNDFIKAGPNAGKKVLVDNIRPYTWAGLDNYLFRNGIIDNIENYRYNDR